MSRLAKKQDVAFVTGYWLPARQAAPNDLDKHKISEFLNRIEHRKLVFFYDNLEVMDHVRHECFDRNIKLIGAGLKTDALPGEKWVDEFMKSTKLYGVSQNQTVTLPNHMDKAWTLYWMNYVRFGEEAYRSMLSAKLSKVALSAVTAADIATFGYDKLTWLDIDFQKWMGEVDLIQEIEQSSDISQVEHCKSYYYYFDQKLPVAGFCLSASATSWTALNEAFTEELDRLGTFPYAYDEEVLLSHAKFQHPQLFAVLGEQRPEMQLYKMA